MFISQSYKNTRTLLLPLEYGSQTNVVLQNIKNVRIFCILIRKFSVKLCILGFIWLWHGYRHMRIAFLIVLLFFCLTMWHTEGSLTYLGPCKHLDRVGRDIMVHQKLASICCILPLVSQDCIMGSQFVNLCRHHIYS